MTGAVLLSFEGVACRRGGRRLFSGFSIDLRAGEALVLTGPNGAGKSSTIRLAAGLLTPDEGRVTASASPGLLTHDPAPDDRSADLTSELQSLMRSSYSFICLKQNTLH